MVMEGSTFGGHSSHLEKCAHPCRGQTYGKNSENAPPAPKMLWLAHASYIQGGVPEIRLSRFKQQVRLLLLSDKN